MTEVPVNWVPLGSRVCRCPTNQSGGRWRQRHGRRENLCHVSMSLRTQDTCHVPNNLCLLVLTNGAVSGLYNYILAQLQHYLCQLTCHFLISTNTTVRKALFLHLQYTLPQPPPTRKAPLKRGWSPHIKRRSLEPRRKWPAIMRLSVKALPPDKGIKMK